jgi:hypothetical protein
VIAGLLNRIALAPFLVCAWAASAFAQRGSTDVDRRLDEYLEEYVRTHPLGEPWHVEDYTQIETVLVVVIIIAFLACLAFLRSSTAQMSILRRNFFRVWLLCSLAWLAFFCEQLYVFGKPPSQDFFIFSLITIILLLIGLRVAPTWEFFVSYWFRLSDHLRTGLTRLYLLVSVPWIAWFGYRLLDALYLTHAGFDARWRSASDALWLLVTVPIGAPIVMIGVLWVIAGFRGQAAQ